MPRKFWLIPLAVLVVALLVVAEVYLRQWEQPRATLQIINEAGGLMEDLVVAYGDTRMPVGTFAQGQSVTLSMTAGPLGPLRLEFHQKSNAIRSLEIPDYDPAQNVQDGYKQVLVIGNNQIQRYAEDDDTANARQSLGQTIKEWLKSAFYVGK